MALDEFLENVVFAATLDAYLYSSRMEGSMDVMVHLEARQALIYRYCPQLLQGEEAARAAVLHRSLYRQWRGAAGDFWSALERARV